MSLYLDPFAARQRHQEMLREAAKARFARIAREGNGAESLLSRMVKLLSRSSRPAHQSGHPEGTLTQPQLANAKGS